MAKSLGSVDLLGLNEYGVNTGLNPIYGVLIGGGLSATSAVVLRHAASGKLAEHANLIGFGLGAAAGGVMYAMKGTRHASFAAFAGAFIGAGIAALEQYLAGKNAQPVGMGIPMIQSLGIPQIQALNGHQIAPIPQSYGTIPGVAGPQINSNGQPPVNLMGEQSPQQSQAVLLGGPPTSGIANHYGANLFGGRN